MANAKCATKLCISYRYEPSPIGFIGGCKLGLFGGFHVITCYGKGDCKYYKGGR